MAKEKVKVKGSAMGTDSAKVRDSEKDSGLVTEMDSEKVRVTGSALAAAHRTVPRSSGR